MLHAKITLDDDMAVGDDRRRGTERVAIGRPSTVRTNGLGPRDVVVENLSSSGFRFRSDDRLATGTMLHVGLGGGGMSQARVIRVEGARHGCEFVHPLNDEQLRLAFRPDTVVAGAFPELHPSPVIAYRDEKLPGAARLGILIAGGTLSWLALFQIGTALFR